MKPPISSILPLSPDQQELVASPVESRIFLEGPAGTGKTTAGVARMGALIEQGEPAGTFLILVPQRTLAAPYIQAMRAPGLRPGGMVDVLTIGGLAQRMVNLFWPLAAKQAGFAHPNQPPTFLTLESAQYYMALLVRPLFDQGYFDSISIDRNRLYSQILDNLNKSALVGFSYTEIADRLKSAWVGEPAQRRVYDDAQDCAHRFRQYCLEHNLLDFSLQLEIFANILWKTPACRKYLFHRYAHLIFDNLEEDTPVAHDIVRDWLPDFRSALLIFDWQGGYRRFLGADPVSASSLRDCCHLQACYSESFTGSAGLRVLGAEMARSFHQQNPEPDPGLVSRNGEVRSVLRFETHRFHPEMLDWVAREIASQVHEQGIPPQEIVVLAPFMSDSLRFSLMNRLKRLDVPARSHRPSRSLRDEPAAQAVITLAALAHPRWKIPLTRYDISYALIQAIDGLDLVRSHFLSEFGFRIRDGYPILVGFDQIEPAMQVRIGYRIGQMYQGLRDWIEAYQQEPPVELDYFISRLFGEVLSQPGYGFHRDFDAGEVTANLIESIRKFRWALAEYWNREGSDLGQEYIRMLQEGVVAAQYLGKWQRLPQEAVLLAPAYTFLMSNRPVENQFWLDVGSMGWWERLNQPLTQPYVLSRSWPKDTVWSDADEYEANQESLYLLCLGLIRRCRGKIYLGLTELSEQGYEMQGPLLEAFQQILRRHPAEMGLAHV